MVSDLTNDFIVGSLLDCDRYIRSSVRKDIISKDSGGLTISQMGGHQPIITSRKRSFWQSNVFTRVMG